MLGARGDFTTDRGDASGTGYWDPAHGTYQDAIIEQAFGRLLHTPRVLEPAEAAGESPEGCVVGPGTGDNMAAALGLDPQPGDVIVSLGTSGTVFAPQERPTADSSGTVAGFADATGRFLPLVATLNAARVLTSTATMLGTDLAGLDRLALAAAPGAGGIVFLPYLDGERTPNLPNATGSLHHLTRAGLTPANIARAAVEGMLCGLADALTALRSQGVETRRVVLIGGGAQSSAVHAIAPAIFGLPICVPSSQEYVALGAARQAAWVFHGGRNPPTWDMGVYEAREFHAENPARELTEIFAQTRRSIYGK
jgi:xylulokinase